MDKLNINAFRVSGNAHLPAAALQGGVNARAAASDWQAIFGGKALTALELQGIESIQSLRFLRSGELAFSRHQGAQGLVAVLKGSVGLGLARNDEPFHLERTVHGPQWLDLSSAWLGGSFGQDARAVSDAWLIELPLTGVRELVSRQPGLLGRFLTSLARTVHSLTGMTHDLMHKDAEHRLAVWLLQHCVADEEAPDEAIISLKERKRDIAAQLAITPETLSRMMRQLNRKGVIEVLGYRVKVLDLPRLRDLAQD